MIRAKDLTRELGNLSCEDEIILNNFCDIKHAFEQVKIQCSNVELNKNCAITNLGLKDYLSYRSDSLKFIHELSISESIKIHFSELRKSNRSLSTILRNVLVGNLGELTFALDYGMDWQSFKGQLAEKSGTATAYDLELDGKHVEIKTIHHRHLYGTDSCIPIDTSNNSGYHPKYWRSKLGGFDVLVPFYAWQGRLRPLGELPWSKYMMKSFFYGTGAGEAGEFYAKKMIEDPKLRRKIMIPISDLEEVGSNF